MNDCKIWLSVAIKIGTDHPHASIIIHLFSNLTEPVNQCAIISNTKINKRKKTYGTHDLHPTHAINIIVAIHEDTIVAWHSLEPQRCCLDNFLSHDAVVTWITWCMECCNCMVEDIDMAGESWTAMVRCFMNVDIMELLTQELANELRKVWHIEFME